MTIFTCFPMALTIRVWDHLLAEGLVYLFKFPLALMEILQDRLLAEEIDGVNEIMMSLRNGSLEDASLPPVEVIMDKASKVDVTKQDLMLLKKEYDFTVAKNPPKVIKRLPTLFEIINEEEKGEMSSIFPLTNPSPEMNQFTPTKVELSFILVC